MEKEQCNVCLGIGTYMEAKETGRGFVYIDCKLCEGSGRVLPSVNEDYNLSLNEEYFDDE